MNPKAAVLLLWENKKFCQKNFHSHLRTKQFSFWQVVVENPCINILEVQELFPNTFHLECPNLGFRLT